MFENMFENKVLTKKVEKELKVHVKHKHKKLKVL